MTEDVLHMLYRGPLASCNYDCWYCPFAKHRSDATELARDRDALHRFSDWVRLTASRPLTLLLTPWGEALVRRWYQEALVELSHLPVVRKVAIQTNLSCRVDWLAEADPLHLGLWCTFHPGEARIESFLARCRRLDELGIRYSVGLVGLHENLSWGQTLRAELPTNVYLWINAYKSGGPDYYCEEEIEAFTAVDPLFPINNRRHPSRGRSCRSGASAISVDGDGNVRRCHFVDRVLGNLYEQPLDKMLAERPCPNATCGCHIGYVHLDELKLHAVFGNNLPERIPQSY
jgi:hypothetical protein